MSREGPGSSTVHTILHAVHRIYAPATVELMRCSSEGLSDSFGS